MTLKLLDSVELVVDLPEKGLKAGTKGAVVEVFEEPFSAYIVEFYDDEGNTIDCYTVSPDSVVKQAI